MSVAAGITAAYLSRIAGAAEKLRKIADLLTKHRAEIGLTEITMIEPVSPQWNSGTPTVRKVYRVRSNRMQNNDYFGYGYRYWDGKTWGPLHAKFKWAREAGPDGRHRTLKYNVLWWGTPQ